MSTSFPTAGKGVSINLSAASLAKAEQLLRKGDEDSTGLVHKSQPAFKTAGRGSTISLSDESMATAERLLQFNEANKDMLTLDSGSVTVAASRSAAEEGVPIKLSGNRTPVVAAVFATCGKRSAVAISDESMSDAERLLQYEEDATIADVLHSEKGSASTSVTFSTAGKGVSFKFSEVDLAKAGKILCRSVDDEEQDQAEAGDSSQPLSFLPRSANVARMNLIPSAPTAFATAGKALTSEISDGNFSTAERRLQTQAKAAKSSVLSSHNEGAPENEISRKVKQEEPCVMMISDQMPQLEAALERPTAIPSSDDRSDKVNPTQHTRPRNDAGTVEPFLTRNLVEVTSSSRPGIGNKQLASGGVDAVDAKGLGVTDKSCSYRTGEKTEQPLGTEDSEDVLGDKQTSQVTPCRNNFEIDVSRAASLNSHHPNVADDTSALMSGVPFNGLRDKGTGDSISRNSNVLNSSASRQRKIAGSKAAGEVYHGQFTSNELLEQSSIEKPTIVPATPFQPVATPHHQLVRWGSIRRVTYGLTPSSPSSPVNSFENGGGACDNISPILVQVGGQGSKRQESAQEAHRDDCIDSTPNTHAIHIRSAKVTMSVNESSPRERKPRNETTCMTPVPINFQSEHDDCIPLVETPANNESNADLPDCQSNLSLETSFKRQEQSSGRSSFKESIITGQMTNDPADCLLHGVNKVTMLVDSINSNKLRFDSDSGLPVGFIGSQILGPRILGDIADIRCAMMASGHFEPCKPGDNWILNHMRWIVWKLASYERRFSTFLAGRYLNYKTMISQLGDRFRREIKEGQRSALRKVLNRDVASIRMMILCVCQVFTTDSRSPVEVADKKKSALASHKIELTDGWYSIQAVLDKELSEFIDSGIIKVGTKLLVSNAFMVGADDGIDPLDDGYTPHLETTQIGLKLTVNATRLARWNAQLGFVHSPILRRTKGLLHVKRISDIVAGGGNIPFIKLLVSRRYPLLYFEKSGDSSSLGKRSVLTEADEDSRKRESEKRKLKAIEKLAESIEREVEKEIDEMAPEVFVRMGKSTSPSDFFEMLTDNEKQIILSWQEKRIVVIRDRVQKEIEAELECDTSLIRESTPFIRLMVQTFGNSTYYTPTTSEQALLTIWQPTEEHLGVLKEGTVIQVQNLSVNNSKYDGLLQLTANSRTCIESLDKSSTPVPDLGFTKRWFQNIFQIHVLSHKLLASADARTLVTDVDTVVVLLRIEGDPASSSEGGLLLFVTDESNLILRVHCDSAPPGLDSFSSHCQGRYELEQHRVLSLCDLRVLPFDPAACCAVARFGDTSSLNKSASGRFNGLRTWASSSGQKQLEMMASYLHGRLPLRQHPDWSFAVGYILGMKVVSSNRVHLEVDCGGEEIQEWEFPVHLFEVMAAIEWHTCSVALDAEEEERVAALGVMGTVFRARGVLCRFRLRRKTEAVSSTCDFVVVGVAVADCTTLSNIYLRQTFTHRIPLRSKSSIC